MNKERALLNKAIEMIQIVPMMASIGNVPPDFGSELILEIKELLAQPEQTEPVYWENEKKALLNEIDHLTNRLAQPERKSFSDEEITKAFTKFVFGTWDSKSYRSGFKDAEKVHGITGVYDAI